MMAGAMMMAGVMMMAGMMMMNVTSFIHSCETTHFLGNTGAGYSEWGV